MQKPMADRNWLAIISANGCGSWARAETREEAVANVKRIFRADWKTLFQKPKEGVTVMVWDLTGYDQVWWDHPAYVKEGHLPIPKDRCSKETVVYDRW